MCGALKKVTTLRDELGRDVSISEVKEALIKGFENAYRINLVESKSLMDKSVQTYLSFQSS
ncbi:MAG: hypothetical protein AOA65_2203 [Candidatus Bathyarchaeota archaeon BA1]|nr:MAG: hypothetical protein AOA65_2203 [Candidatus Bathyarchaeota archaeon BA1]